MIYDPQEIDSLEGGDSSMDQHVIPIDLNVKSGISIVHLAIWGYVRGGGAGVFKKMATDAPEVLKAFRGPEWENTGLKQIVDLDSIRNDTIDLMNISGLSQELKDKVGKLLEEIDAVASTGDPKDNPVALCRAYGLQTNARQIHSEMRLAGLAAMEASFKAGILEDGNRAQNHCSHDRSKQRRLWGWKKIFEGQKKVVEEMLPVVKKILKEKK